MRVAALTAAAAAALAPLVVALAPLGMVGCSKSDDPNSADYWLARLDDRNTRADQRSEALRTLGKIGDKSAIPEIEHWLETDGDWQGEAAHALGQLGDTAVVPKLIAAIDYKVGSGHDHNSVRKNRLNQGIARGLAQLKAKEGVDPLLKLLDAAEPKTREAVIHALGELGDNRATAPLTKIALEETQPFLRSAAIHALGELGDPKGVPALIQNLFFELAGTSFYFDARYALVQVGQSAVPLLTKTLQRGNPDVEAIRLGNGEKISEGGIEAKAAFVLGALRAKDAEDLLVASLAKFYKKFKEAKAGQAPLGTVGAVIELCYALGNLGSSKAVTLLQTIAADIDPNMRTSASDALTAIGAKEAVPGLLKAARTGPPPSRQAAVVAASRLGDGDDLAAFDALAKVGDTVVPAEDMAALIGIVRPRLEAAKACKKEAPCWLEKLKDKSPIVRDRAARELGWLKAPTAIPALLKAAEDEDTDVRLAAVQSLWMFESGVDVAALQALYDKSVDKVAFQESNAGLLRLIARLRSTEHK